MSLLQRRFSRVVIGNEAVLQKGASIRSENGDKSQGFFNPAAVELVAAKTLKAEDSGKTFYLNAAAEFATTLPMPALGLSFRFIVKAAPSGADYTIVTANSANIIKGHVLSADLNAAGDGDIETSGADTISFVSAKAVAGDVVELHSDGVNWFSSAKCSLFDAITMTTVS